MVHTAKLSTDCLVNRFPLPEAIPESGALWVMVFGNGIALNSENTPTILSKTSPARMSCNVERVQYLGHRDATPCYAAEVASGTILPDGWELDDVKKLFGRVPDDELAVAALFCHL